MFNPMALTKVNTFLKVDRLFPRDSKFFRFTSTRNRYYSGHMFFGKMVGDLRRAFISV